MAKKQPTKKPTLKALTDTQEESVETPVLTEATPKKTPAKSPAKKAAKKPVKKSSKKKGAADTGIDAAFGAFMAAAEERWPGSIKVASKLPTDGTPTMSTGNFVLDRMTYGGLRRGRLYRFWGVPKSAKTGSALNCAEAFTNNHCGRCFEHRLKCQCEGPFVYAKCLYVDVEGRIADNRPWAEKHGIHPDRLAMVAPKGGEQVVDIADAALRSDAGIGLVIIDSIAQMTAVDEVIKAAEKGKTIGRNAMLVNSALRKWVCSIVSKDIDSTRKPTIILINQLRQKTSAFGCFHGETPVVFANGNSFPIKEVVERQIRGPVLSWDGDQVIEREIIAWHDNGYLNHDQEWLTFKVRGTGGRRGAMGFTCTGNHVMVDGAGQEIRASDVRVSDRLMSWFEQTLSKGEQEVLLGILMGDGHLHLVDGCDSSAFLHLANSEQPAYLFWKMCQFKALGFKKHIGKSRTYWTSSASFELGLERQWFCPKGGDSDSINYKQIPEGAIRSASLLTLAIWYMDNGSYDESHQNASISVKRLTVDDGRRAALELSERYPGVIYRESQKAICFTVPAFQAFSSDISEFVPACMYYKLLPAHRPEGRRDFFVGLDPVRSREMISAEVISIKKSKRKMRARRKYDLTIDGDSFYLVGGDSRGVIVHNSPDVMPGGLGQGYASACDIKFTKRQKHYLMSDGKGGYNDKVVKFGGKWKPGEDDTADFIEIETKITDSGICPPGRYGTFHYWMRAGHGRRVGDTDNTLWLWEYAKKYGILKKKEKGQGYTLLGLEARTQKDMEKLLLEDTDTQDRVWIELMEILSK